MAPCLAAMSFGRPIAWRAGAMLARPRCNEASHGKSQLSRSTDWDSGSSYRCDVYMAFWGTWGNVACKRQGQAWLAKPRSSTLMLLDRVYTCPCMPCIAHGRCVGPNWPIGKVMLAKVPEHLMNGFPCRGNWLIGNAIRLHCGWSA